MINLIYQFVVSLLMSVVMLQISYFGGWQLGSSKWFSAINSSIIAFIVLLHTSLYWLSIDFLLYVWFWSSIGHFWIHAYVSKLTIAETRRFSLDEVWHLSNQLMIIFYLFTRYQSEKSVYLIHVFLFIIYVSLILFTYSSKKRWTYLVISELGTFIEFVFIFLLAPNVSLLSILPSAMVQVIFTWVVTFNNKIGRLLLLVDVAGCSFIGEFVILFFLHNNIFPNNLLYFKL